MLLTTITSRIGFYSGAGFRRLDLHEIPRCAHVGSLHQRSHRLPHTASPDCVLCVGLLPACVLIQQLDCNLQCRMHRAINAQDPLHVACRSLLFEVIAGTVVARLAAGEELVVLKK